MVDKLGLPGGVARVFGENGFVFDAGPSWYLLPKVCERYFGFFGKKPSDYYTLLSLEPLYKILFEDGTRAEISRDQKKNCALFDSLEKDGGKKLEAFLTNAENKYRIAVDKFLYREYTSRCFRARVPSRRRSFDRPARTRR